jgi:hypothetical protein
MCANELLIPFCSCENKYFKWAKGTHHLKDVPSSVFNAKSAERMLIPPVVPKGKQAYKNPLELFAVSSMLHLVFHG